MRTVESKIAQQSGQTQPYKTILDLRFFSFILFLCYVFPFYLLFSEFLCLSFFIVSPSFLFGFLLSFSPFVLSLFFSTHVFKSTCIQWRKLLSFVTPVISEEITCFEDDCWDNPSKKKGMPKHRRACFHQSAKKVSYQPQKHVRIQQVT
jgi:hypothetical protein